MTKPARALTHACRPEAQSRQRREGPAVLGMDMKKTELVVDGRASLVDAGDTGGLHWERVSDGVGNCG